MGYNPGWLIWLAASEGNGLTGGYIKQCQSARGGGGRRRGAGDGSSTFQDVNALLVGRVGVGVVRGCEHAAVDVADPCAAVVLVRALASGVARGI